MLRLITMLDPLLCALQVMPEKEKGAHAAAGTASDGESLQSILESFAEFGHWNFLLRLIIGLGLSVVCSVIIAWHPRRSTKIDPLSDLEERKAFILLGLVGAVVAELGINQNLAFVIFGIGALVRFRTVLDNPKATGKALLVVVIGLACGMGQWAMAVFVTAATWTLVYWLDSRLSCRIRLRVGKQQDPKVVYADVLEFLRGSHIAVKGSNVYEDKRQMVFLAHVPSYLDPLTLEAGLRTKLDKAANGAQIEVRMG